MMKVYKPNKKIKNINIDYPRMNEAENRRAEYGVTAITANKAEELLAMAAEGVTPDGSYSDYEVSVWEVFTRVLREEGLSK